MQSHINEKNSFGERLRAERQRLGYTQDAFGAGAGVTRLTQAKYEKGESSPNVDYLIAVEEMAADIDYLLTGERREYKSMDVVHGEYADLAASITEEIETAMIAKGIQLSPAKKGQLVATIYRNSRTGSPVDVRLVSDLLALASA